MRRRDLQPAAGSSAPEPAIEQALDEVSAEEEAAVIDGGSKSGSE